MSPWFLQPYSLLPVLHLFPFPSYLLHLIDFFLSSMIFCNLLFSAFKSFTSFSRADVDAKFAPKSSRELDYVLAYYNSLTRIRAGLGLGAKFVADGETQSILEVLQK